MLRNAPRPRVAAILLAATLLTGCGAGSPVDGGGGKSPPGFPVTIENCGREVTIDAPPRRAVSLNQTVTEMLLSLGLADRMAGTATWTDPILPRLAAANASVPRLAENEPSLERVLAEEPDFVAGSFQSTFERVGSRDAFARLGVPTYLTPSDCLHKSNAGSGDVRREQPLEMATVYTAVKRLATIFGVPDRGQQLVSALRHRMRQATQHVDASGVTMAYWFANSEAPYVAGCCGAPGIITKRLGATNVFADTKQEWPQVGWESIASRNPDVLVLGDLTRDRQTAESGRAKIRFLESNPVTKNMDAVRNDRYILLSGQAMDPSIRLVNGTEKVATKLREFGLTR